MYPASPYILYSRCRRWAIHAIGLALTIALLCGCQKSLFMKKHARHQFQTHDAMRHRNVPLTEPDVFGNPQPALRARLSQRR